MAFNPQEAPKRDFTLPDEGLYAARCARIIELGDQETKYGVKSQVVFGFTIPALKVMVGDEEKQQLFWTFPITLTSNADSTCMKYVKALNASATHLNQCLGKACMLELSHSKPKPDGTQYANISSVTKAMAGMDIPEPDCEMFMYEFENGEDEIFQKLGEFRQNQIKAALNFGQ